ncbi:EamA family transporter [Porphyrobacter algicida]|uniref:EamA family transporter n=2 Tax=Qipengyuania algicida TaxID=1836209 RepID=A0A845ALZ0_9SPHN|nr:DMT family transporter [Qipengyuania algicida]MXP29536.1 EamA family transporter [Qipengyuania algicida]
MARSYAALPILAALFGIACLSLMDAFMKGASLAIGAYSAAWLRSTMGAALATPLWLLRGGRWPHRPVLELHVQRGVVSTFMAITFFYALTKLAIAEAIAISFVAPILALYLAHTLLGESIHRAAILAAILGLAGTLVIVGGKISRSTFDNDTMLGLAAILTSAALYAYNFILIRRQSQAAGPLEIAAFHSGVSAMVLGIAAPFLFTAPAIGNLWGIACAAALTVIGAIAIAWAYAREEAQALVPMEYSGFLWASLFGWLFFREKLAVTTIIGAGLIVLGCWIAARRKRTEQAAI